MKQKIAMAAAVVAFLCSIGVGGYFFERSYHGKDPTPNDHSSAEREAKAGEPSAHFEEMVESLRRIQDRVVYGERSALQEQEEQFIRIAEEFDRIDASKPVEPPDFRAVLVYALSGGERDVLERFVTVWPPAEQERNLVEGVRQFIQGNSEESLRLLDPLQPFSLDPHLTGPVALAKASLYAAKNLEKANDALDIARLVEPHTALEEAAIRRQIALLFNQKKSPQAIRLVAEYLRRYGKSAHAPSVLEYTGKIFLELDAGSGAVHISEFNDDLEFVDSNLRAEALLSIAKAALSKGKLDAATSAATLCLHLEDIEEKARERARLYIAVAGAPTESATSAQEVLDQIRPGELSQDDVEMRGAAARVAASVIRPAVAGESQVDSAPSEKGSAEIQTVAPNANLPIKSILERATGALKSSAAAINARIQ